MKPNTLLNRVQREDLDTDMQAQWDNATQLTGDATFIEVFGNNPKVFNWYIDDFYQKLFYSGRIETTLVELIRLRLANIHGCAFCNKGDSVHALEAGISQQQIDMVQLQVQQNNQKMMLIVLNFILQGNGLLVQ